MRFYRFLLGLLSVWRITHLLNAEDGPFEVLATFTIQIQLQRHMFIPFRQELLRYDPYSFLQNLPKYAQLVQLGKRDKKMQEVYMETIPVMFEMILKSKLDEESG